MKDLLKIYFKAADGVVTVNMGNALSDNRKTLMVKKESSNTQGISFAGEFDRILVLLNNENEIADMVFCKGTDVLGLNTLPSSPPVLDSYSFEVVIKNGVMNFEIPDDICKVSNRSILQKEPSRFTTYAYKHFCVVVEIKDSDEAYVVTRKGRTHYSTCTTTAIDLYYAEKKRVMDFLGKTLSKITAV